LFCADVNIDLSGENISIITRNRSFNSCYYGIWSGSIFWEDLSTCSCLVNGMQDKL